MDYALPERLGELVRALLGEHPDVEVLTDVKAAVDATEGSVLVLVPKAEDAEWLNLRRPIFAQRQLKVVLFCDRGTTLALSERAVDFFDWVSQHHDCPQGPPLHAVFGFRSAVAADAPGIVWLGTEADKGGMWRALSAAFPGDALTWISPQRDYEEMIEAIRAVGDGWVACHIRTAAHLMHFRWALAEVGKRGKAIVMMERAECPGWWPVHDRRLLLEEARMRCVWLGMAKPGRIAALTGLEPEAMDVVGLLWEKGVSETKLVDLLAGEEDGGAALSKKAYRMGLVDREALLWRKAPLLLRGLDGEEEVRRVREERLKARSAVLARGEDEAVGYWAAMGVRLQRVRKLRPSRNRALLSYWGESRLSPGAGAQQWAEASYAAFHVGEKDIAGFYAQRSIERSKSLLRPLTIFIIQRLSFDMTRRGPFFASVDKALKYRFLVLQLVVWPCLGGMLLSALLIGGYFKSWLAWLVAFLVGFRVSFVLPERIIFPSRSRLPQSWQRPNPSKAPEIGNLLFAGDYLPEGTDEPSLDRAICHEARAAGVQGLRFSALMVELAQLLVRRGDAPGAEILLRRTLAQASETTNAPLPWLSPETQEYIHLFLIQPGIPRDLPPEARARALRILAEVLLAQGRYQEAQEAAQQALDQSLRASRIARPEQWRSLAMLGRARVLQDRYREGKANLHAALEQAEKAFGKNHLEASRILLELARLEARRGDADAPTTARRAMKAWAACKCEASERDEVLKELQAIA